MPIIKFRIFCDAQKIRKILITSKYNFSDITKRFNVPMLVCSYIAYNLLTLDVFGHVQIVIVMLSLIQL